MKRFFDLSLLLIIPLFLIGNFGTEPTPATTPEISKQAMEIHALVADQIDMSVEDIQEVLDNVDGFEALAMAAEGGCTLSCNPNPCCYQQGHLDRLIIEFGCCIADGNCPWPCLDLNGSGCVTAADLTILLANWCVN